MTVRVTTLESGLRVVTDEMPQVETVSMGVWVGVGTRDERVEINGVAHLLEHMAFKGTARRSARDIAEAIEAVGGHLNAYTSREHTAYFAKVLKEDAALAVDVLSDILQHSVFDEKELSRERAVIVQEIGQAFDTPDDLVFDNFHSAAFPGQAIGRSVLGTAKVIESMPRQSVVSYMAEHYVPPCMVASAAGHIDHDTFVRLIAEAFDSLPGGDPEGHEAARYEGGDSREGRQLEQVHMVLGFDGVAFADPDYFALSVLSTALGGGMSSRLFQEVREKRGLAYSIYSFASSYTDGGVFVIYAGTGEKEAAELIPLVCDEVAGIGATVTEEELERARTQCRAGILMSLESSAGRCEQLGQQMLVFGRPIPVAELVERIEAVDRAAIARVAGGLLAGRPTFAAVGPLTHVESYDRMAARVSAGPS
jgi:predicted Zn-dependent peptidase